MIGADQSGHESMAPAASAVEHAAGPAATALLTRSRDHAGRTLDAVAGTPGRVIATEVTGDQTAIWNRTVTSRLAPSPAPGPR